MEASTKSKTTKTTRKFSVPTKSTPLSSNMESILREVKNPTVGQVLPITPNAGYEVEKRGLASKEVVTEDSKQRTEYKLTADGVKTIKAIKKG